MAPAHVWLSNNGQILHLKCADMQAALRHEEASEAQGKTPYSFPMVQLQAIN